MVNDGLRSTNLKVTNTDFTDLVTGSVTASNVAVVTTFPTAFSEAPRVLTTLAQSGAATAYGGAVTGTSAGSFTFLGTSGLEYTYQARKAD